MKNAKRHILFIFLLSFYVIAPAQSFNLQIDDDLTKCIEENYYANPQNHTVIRPLQIEISKYQSLLDSCFSNNENKKWIFDSNFINASNAKNGLYINPVLTDISKLNDGFYTENGITALTWLGKNLSANFTGTFIYTQPKYKKKFIPYEDIFIPHFGKAEKYSSFYTYLNLTGYLSYQVADFMNLQIGRDKVFWGDGYRSLFISDNSNANPFFKGTVDIWKIKYTILYSYYHEKDSLDGFNFGAKKYSSSHILSWNIGKRLNFNIFETVIWQEKDSIGNRGFDVNYLNPIIFYRPVEFSLGSPDNVIMGFGGRIRVFKNTHLYGQFLLDEFKLNELKARKGWWGNKFGIQAGVKTFKLFGIENLYALGEVNIVKPFTYSHWSYMDNYGSYSQPLAHPLGANFAEGILNIRYRIERWQINTLLKKYVYGADYDTLNTGFNIYRSYNDHVNEFGNKLLQGQKYRVTSIELSLGYLLNPKWMLSFKFGFRFDFLRMQRIATTFLPTNGYYEDWNQFIFFGLYTNIGNREWLY